MNSKRMKLRVASACTAVLLVGSMMASSASVFANTEGNGSVSITNRRSEQNHQICCCLNEIGQLRRRLYEVIDREAERRMQQIESQRTELTQLRSERDALRDCMTRTNNRQNIIRPLRGMIIRIRRQESLIETLSQQLENFQQEVLRIEMEVSNWDRQLEEMTEDYEGIMAELANATNRREPDANNESLDSQIQQLELRVFRQGELSLPILENIRNWYDTTLHALENNTRTEAPGTPAE